MSLYAPAYLKLVCWFHVIECDIVEQFSNRTFIYVPRAPGQKNSQELDTPLSFFPLSADKHQYKMLLQF